MYHILSYLPLLISTAINILLLLNIVMTDSIFNEFDSCDVVSFPFIVSVYVTTTWCFL